MASSHALDVLDHAAPLVGGAVAGVHAKRLGYGFAGAAALLAVLQPPFVVEPDGSLHHGRVLAWSAVAALASFIVPAPPNAHGAAN